MNALLSICAVCTAPYINTKVYKIVKCARKKEKKENRGREKENERNDDDNIKNTHTHTQK